VLEGALRLTAVVDMWATTIFSQSTLWYPLASFRWFLVLFLAFAAASVASVFNIIMFLVPV